MIARTYVEANLKSLNYLFGQAKTPKHTLYYSKLALLELCGWIEESMDDVVLRCAKRCLTQPANIKYTTDQIIKRTYGFDYDLNFRGMLIRLLGIIVVERIEATVDPIKQARLRATLTSLKRARDAEAHTHLKGVTRTINAPSVTLSHFRDAYDGLIEYERVIRQLNIRI